VTSNWQIIGVGPLIPSHSSSSAIEGEAENEKEVLMEPEWLITYFNKTLFTSSGIDL